MGRFLTLCTLVADLFGLVASYSMGAFFFPWLGSILPGWLFWLRFLCFYLYHELFQLIERIPHAPHSILLMLTEHPGLTCCLLYLIAHLWYVVSHFYRLHQESDLAKPQPGAPGGRRWEIVQRRYQDYQQALGRFRPGITLKTPPSFRFFRRKSVQDTRGGLEWRGHRLIIDQALLSPDRQQDFAPGLAHQLAYYNSEDLWFRSFLDCYPDSFSVFQLMSGICIWVPTLVKILIWPTVYWRKRVMAADRFAEYCGQGYLLYQQLRYQGNEEEQRSFWSPVPLRAERLEQLEAMLGTEFAWLEKQGLTQAMQAPRQLSRG